MGTKSDIALLAGVLLVATGAAADWGVGEWPVLREYDGEHLYRIALPVGGIGTGTISLGGRGELRDWELMNTPAKGFTGVETGNDAPFLAIRADGGSRSFSSILEGPLLDHEYLSPMGKGANHYGMPRFHRARFAAAYPYGAVKLEDDASPVRVQVRAFNPFVPGDSAASSLPVATFTVAVSNLTDAPLAVSVMGALRNFIGNSGRKPKFDWLGDRISSGATNNVNAFRAEDGIRGLYLTSKGVARNDIAWGTLALTTADRGEVTYRTDTIKGVWFEGLRDIWTEFTEKGRLTTEGKGPSGDRQPWAALCLAKKVPAHGTETFTFHFTWSFPNRLDWGYKSVIGNHYAGLYPDAWNAARRIIPTLPALERRSRAFAEAFLATDYPECVKEAALFNLATLRSPTVFRIPSGHLMGWEGVSNWEGLCCGNCTHVWNYEQATAFLFADLARTMRDVEFNYATRTNGLMMFRADLPLSAATGNGASKHPAADGQLGTVMKAYREWLNCGDREWLKAIWPRVKLVLSFVWSKDGTWNWDADGDGVMEGRQHNTMDVDYYGPNPQMQFWYLGALRAAEELAKVVGDDDFAAECARKFAVGREKSDQLLFNGEYYEHRQTPGDTHTFQLGPGCLVDQLVGQTFARLVGLGELGVGGHTRQAITSVWKYNRVENASRNFCSQRGYMLGDEAGLLMASWPRGKINCPFPYSEEAMTGFEYVAATEMVYAGMEKEAVETVRSVRARHDGAKRNPYSEPECGHHYARSMASWGVHLAWSGFHFSAPDRVMTFGSREGRWFWSNGSAWGTFARQGDTAELSVIEGSIDLAELRIDGFAKPVGRALKLGPSERTSCRVSLVD